MNAEDSGFVGQVPDVKVLLARAPTSKTSLLNKHLPTAQLDKELGRPSHDVLLGNPGGPR